MENKYYIRVLLLFVALYGIVYLVYKYKDYKNIFSDEVFLFATKSLPQISNMYMSKYVKYPSSNKEIIKFISGEDIKSYDFDIPEIVKRKGLMVLKTNDTYIVYLSKNEVKIDKLKYPLSFKDYLLGYKLILYGIEDFNLCDFHPKYLRMFRRGESLCDSIIEKHFNRNKQRIVFYNTDESYRVGHDPKEFYVYCKRDSNKLEFKVLCKEDSTLFFDKYKDKLISSIDSMMLNDNFDEVYFPVYVW